MGCTAQLRNVQPVLLCACSSADQQPADVRCPACTLSSYDQVLNLKTCLIIAEKNPIKRGAEKGPIIAKKRVL